MIALISAALPPASVAAAADTGTGRVKVSVTHADPPGRPGGRAVDDIHNDPDDVPCAVDPEFNGICAGGL